MHGFSTWRLGMVSCGATVAMVLLVWTRLKSIRSDKTSATHTTPSKRESTKNIANENYTPNDIDELPAPTWVKVGNIKELYIYPLKSGRGMHLEACEFTEYGIAWERDRFLTLNDRMFLVYSEETGKFITGRNYPTLILVSLTAADETRVQLQATGLPNLTFTVPKSSNSSSQVICRMWWGESVKCIDCGPAPARWISKFLTGTNSGMRIGVAVNARRNILKGPWERFTKVYERLRDEDTGYFADIASYMLMSDTSLDTLNKKLTTPTTSLQFRPNIVISGAKSFDEDNWEWIKIGDSVVIRNVKPCSRCSMIGVNPETGIFNEQEPMKVLRSFREQTDERRIKVDGTAPVMGIYCGLYSPGHVKIDDAVFVHVGKTVRTTAL